MLGTLTVMMFRNLANNKILRKRNLMKKQPTIYTDNSDLYDADKAVKDFVKVHKGKLSEENSDALGDLLDRRAAAISNVLGVKVSSVVDHKKK